MLDKSRRLPVDVIMLDLEDGVVDARKDEARSLVAAALQHPHNVHEPRRYVRINGPEARPFQRDIDAIVPTGSDHETRLRHFAEQRVGDSSASILIQRSGK